MRTVAATAALALVALIAAGCFGGGSPSSPEGPGLILYRDSVTGALTVSDPDGEERRALRLNAAPTEPLATACDRDGRRLVYALGDEVTDQSYLYILGEGASDEPTRLDGVVRNLSLSPDGERLALSRIEPGTARSNLYLMDVAGGELTMLPSPQGTTTGPPSWSPDGERLVYSTHLDGRFALYVLDIEGGEEVRLTQEELPERDPDWSPDGETLIFVSAAGDNARQLFTSDASGANKQQLTESTTLKATPRWSLDGSLIAFAGTVPQSELGVSTDASLAHNLGVWIAAPDGSDERLTTDLALDAQLMGWCRQGPWLNDLWEAQ